MGKGKSNSSSKSAYDKTKNNCIDNKKFAPNKGINENVHNSSFFYRYLRNSSGEIKITRNTLSVDDKYARNRFIDLVSEFNFNCKQNIRTISKDELMFLFLDFVENTNSIIHLKDDSRQFLTYRFLYPDIMKLYLYKMFYPRIFDFDITENDGEKIIIFESPYIEKNFEQIYKNINFMCETIVYDALLIATENCAMKHIASMKSYKASITTSDSVDNILTHLDVQFKSEAKEPKKKADNASENSDKNTKQSESPRITLLKNFKSSIVFFAKHHNHLYRNRTSKDKLLTSIMKNNAFYSGKKADDSRNALIVAYEECSELLKKDAYPFTKLLNMYHINKNSCIYDLNILKDNVDFIPFTLDGIITKHYINKMIAENNTEIQQKIDNSLSLTAPLINPNCIISTLTLKDYEMLNFIITRSAISFEEYYFKSDNADIKVSKVCEIIDTLNNNERTETMVRIIPLFDYLQTNSVDYSLVIDWVKPIPKGDGM